MGQRRATDLSGRTLDELLGRVEAALAPESAPLVKEVIDHIGGLPDDAPLHGFELWLIGLAHGWNRLPARIPHDLVRVWRHGKFGCPPLRRCASCWLAFPNYFSRCPACGHGVMEWQDMAGPLGTFEPVPSGTGGPLVGLEECLHDGHAE